MATSWPGHHRALRLLLLGLCLVSIGLSTRLIATEYQLAILNAGTMSETIDSLTSPDKTIPGPATARSARETVALCARVIRFAPRLKSDPGAARLVQERCLELAAAILQAAPSNARARSLVLLASPAPRPTDLARAQAAAPREPWPLLQRLAALERVTPKDALWHAVAEADIAAALSTPWGRTELAQLYVDTPTLRSIVQAGAEGTPEAAQADFLNQVRRASRGTF